jgi:hypothetical protein
LNFLSTRNRAIFKLRCHSKVWIVDHARLIIPSGKVF